MWSMRRIPLLAVGLAVSLTLVNVPAAHAASPASSSIPSATAAVNTPQQRAVAKIKSTVTTFYTDAQLARIVLKTAEDMYAGKAIAQSFDTPFPAYALDATRQSAIVQLTANVTKDLGSAAVLTKAHTAVLAGFAPVYDRARTQVQACKKAGKTKASCLDTGYLAVVDGLTAASVGAALTNVKKRLTVKEWQSYRTRGAALVLWSKYGL